ncbi:MAG: DegT/DnrJ/EryC1/StrS family aminotransferase [Chloroflexota bacterium]
MLITHEDLALYGGPRAIPEGTVRPWPEIAREDKDAVMRVLDRGTLWGAAAPEVTALQDEWARYVGARYCLATNSGTAALHMAVAAAGVEPGDEVITTPLSWTSTATCILHHNAIPIFADIDLDTFNIDPARIEEKISPRTRAILPVHLYGRAAPMDEIMRIAAGHGIKVIEDCCQAHAATSRGRPVGSIGHLGAFSFNGNKNLPGGEGGALVTDDEEAWQEAARVQQFGEARRTDGAREYNAYGMGWMYRTTEMTAAFVRSQFTRLESITEAIRANARYLGQQLAGVPGLRLPTEETNDRHVYFRYVPRFVPEELGLDVPLGEATEKIRRALVAEGVPLGRAEFVIPGMTLFREKRGYGKGCPWTCQYHQPIEYRAEDYPNAVQAMDSLIPLRCLTPPNGPTAIGRYAHAFKKVFGQLEHVLREDARP